MREERSRRARRGGGRGRERGRDKKTWKQKNIEMLTSMRGVSCPPHVPMPLM